MRTIGRWIRGNALSVTLLLTALSVGCAIYAVTQIQAERHATVLRNCQDQNRHHAGTVLELDRVLIGALQPHWVIPRQDTLRQLDALLTRAEAQAPVVRRVQIKASKASTLLLIDQLAPYQNCQQVLVKSTSTK